MIAPTRPLTSAESHIILRFPGTLDARLRNDASDALALRNREEARFVHIETLQHVADDRDDMEARYEARWHSLKTVVMLIGAAISGLLIGSVAMKTATLLLSDLPPAAELRSLTLSGW